jgi:hypothetical protein
MPGHAIDVETWVLLQMHFFANHNIPGVARLSPAHSAGRRVGDPDWGSGGPGRALSHGAPGSHAETAVLSQSDWMVVRPEAQ